MIPPITLPPYRPNHRRAQLVITLFVTFILLDSILIAAMLLILNTLRLGDTASADQLLTLQATAQRLNLLGTIQIIAYIVTSLAFLFWIYRAYQNLTALNVRDQSYSPSWAAGGFFVPLLNLVRPYQIVSEIWAKSEPDLSRPATSTSPLIKVWWATFIIGSVLSRVADTSARGNATPDQLIWPMWLTLISIGLQIIAAISGSLVIKSIDDRQEQRLRSLRSFELPTETPRWNPAWFTVSIGLGMLIAGITLVQTPVTTAVIAEATAVTSPTPTPSAPITAQVTPELTRGRPLTTRAPRPTATPHTAADHLARSRRFLAGGVYSMAATELSNAIQDDPNNAELYYLRGISNARLNSPEVALRDFDKALELDSEYAEAYYERGLIHLSMENYGLAGKDFEKAIHLKPKYVNAYVGSGWTHYLSKDYSAALTDLNYAIKLDTKAIEAYHVRGLVYLDTGKFDPAVADFTRAIELEPDSAVAYNRRGMAYHARGDLVEALADFNKAIELKSDLINAYFNRGLVRAAQGNYSDALKDYNRVIDRYGDYGPAYVERAAVYGRQQHFDLAIADLEKALKLNLNAADRRDAEKMLADFKARRSGQSS